MRCTDRLHPSSPRRFWLSLRFRPLIRRRNRARSRSVSDGHGCRAVGPRVDARRPRLRADHADGPFTDRPCNPATSLVRPGGRRLRASARPAAILPFDEDSLLGSAIRFQLVQELETKRCQAGNTSNRRYFQVAAILQKQQRRANIAGLHRFMNLLEKPGAFRRATRRHGKEVLCSISVHTPTFPFCDGIARRD